MEEQQPQQLEEEPEDARPSSESSEEPAPTAVRRPRLKGVTICPECGKTFTHSSSLYGHLRVHSKGVPGEG